MIIKDNEKQSYDSVAEKVCDGWFGNGLERRERLEAAGYDYNTVQSIVNKKMNERERSLRSIRIFGENYRNMSNYRILKAMITECLGSNDISYINMILNLAETIVDDAINRNEDNNEEEDEEDD